MSAMVVFVNNVSKNIPDDFNNRVENFLIELIGVCYSFNMSFELKYRIFDINAAIMNGRDWFVKQESLPEDFFNERNSLRNGLVLLYHFLKYDGYSLGNRTEFPLYRIASASDKNAIYDWPKDNLKVYLKSMANYSIVDFPITNNSLEEKAWDYNNSSLSSVSGLLNGKSYYSFADFKQRENDMIRVLTNFFIKK